MTLYVEKYIPRLVTLARTKSSYGIYIWHHKQTLTLNCGLFVTYTEISRQLKALHDFAPYTVLCLKEGRKCFI